MKNKSEVFAGYTLIELLIVIAIFVILASLGIGGYMRTRETMVAKENVQKIIQDIQIARTKAMFLEKGSDTNWIYGIGIDFRNTDESYETGNYNFFKWCSPFKDFGDPLTQSALPNYDSSKQVGATLTAAICGEPNVPYYNGRIAECYTNSCAPGYMSLVAISGDDLGLIHKEVGQMTILDVNSDHYFPAFIFFEAITGRAIIYNRHGWPYNYENGNGDIENMIPLDIKIKRKYSTKFDLITIYPLSGTVIHHVYSTKDVIPSCADTQGIECFTIGSVSYKRYGIVEEINSYRD